MDLPIACSLDAPSLSRRLDDIAALGREALVDSRVEPGRAVLRFAGAHDRVAAFAAAEAQCCAFLAFRLTDEPVVLTIDAPADAQAVLEELVAAFRGETMPA